MKIIFTEACTVFPDGLSPLVANAGDEVEVSDAYGDLLIDKGHAVAASPAPLNRKPTAVPEPEPEPVMKEITDEV